MLRYITILSILFLIGTMFSFFNNDKVNINYINKGSHGDHWFGLFNEVSPEIILNFCDSSIEGGIEVIGNKDISVITNNLVRAIFNENLILSAFPYFKSSEYEEIEVVSIDEWEHVEGLEAIVKCNHSSGCAIDFFPTDYVFNKEVYKKKQKLSVNITGFIYSLDSFDMPKFNKENDNKLKFSDSFCGYLPFDNDSPATIQFVGVIDKIEEISERNISGFLIKIKITPDLSLDMFLSAKNLNMDLELGELVSGVAWIQGTLEK